MTPQQFAGATNGFGASSDGTSRAAHLSVLRLLRGKWKFPAVWIELHASARGISRLAATVRGSDRDGRW